MRKPYGQCISDLPLDRAVRASKDVVDRKGL